jgi:hypothetical protein
LFWGSYYSWPSRCCKRVQSYEQVCLHHRHLELRLYSIHNLPFVDISFHSQQAINPSAACHFYGQLHARLTHVSSAMRRPSTSQGGSSPTGTMAAMQVTQQARNLTSKVRTCSLIASSQAVRRRQVNATTVATLQRRAHRKAIIPAQNSWIEICLSRRSPFDTS